MFARNHQQNENLPLSHRQEKASVLTRALVNVIDLPRQRSRYPPPAADLAPHFVFRKPDRHTFFVIQILILNYKGEDENEDRAEIPALFHLAITLRFGR
jgi:hypothetical protein